MHNIKYYLSVAKDVGLTPAMAGLLLFMQFLAVAFEGLGISMILPVFEVMERQDAEGNITNASELTRTVSEVLNAIGLPMNLPVLFATVFVCVLLRQIVTYFRLLARAKIQEGILHIARKRIFKAYLDADLQYQTSNHSGSIVNGLTTELKTAAAGLFHPIDGIGYVIMALVYAAVVALVAGVETLLTIVVLCCSGLALRNVLKRSTKSGHQVRSANESMGSFIVDRVSSIRLIRLSQSEQREVKEMDRESTSLLVSSIAMRRYMAASELILEPIIVAIFLALMYVGYTYLSIEIAALSIFLVIAIRFMPTVKQIMQTFQKTLNAHGSLTALQQRLEGLGQSRELDTGSTELTSIQQSIEFREVSYAYDEQNEKALHDVNVTVKCGTLVGLVGPSGSGKSTLIDLLPALRRPQTGKIIIDGAPIETFTLKSLRSRIAYVTQQPYIFDVSIKEHIRYGNASASDEEIAIAAKQADAHDFVSNLPDGYDTRIGEKGGRLSGGQRQRLDLARAFLQDADILVMDEPTSNLDIDSEQEFKTAVKQLRETTNKTIIVAAHRLSTIKNADRIIVLNKGRVEAQGSHDDLLIDSQWYKQAWERYTDHTRD